MDGSLKIKRLTVLGHLLTIHFKSTICVFIFYLIFIAGYSIFSPYFEGAFGSVLNFSALSPLFILFSVPISYMVAFPAFIIGMFVSQEFINRKVDNYFLWILSSFVIGNFYLYYYSSFWFIFSVPISVLNGFFMCRFARRYYDMQGVS